MEEAVYIKEKNMSQYQEEKFVVNGNKDRQFNDTKRTTQ